MTGSDDISHRRYGWFVPAARGRPASAGHDAWHCWGAWRRQLSQLCVLVLWTGVGRVGVGAVVVPQYNLQ